MKWIIILSLMMSACAHSTQNVQDEITQSFSEDLKDKIATETKTLMHKPPYPWEPVWCDNVMLTHIAKTNYKPSKKTTCSWHVKHHDSQASCLVYWEWNGSKWFQNGKFDCYKPISIKPNYRIEPGHQIKALATPYGSLNKR